MIPTDANILHYSYAFASPILPTARTIHEDLFGRDDLILSSVLVNNRKHPHWKTCGFPPRSRRLADELWNSAAKPDLSRRRIYHPRMAFSLIAFGTGDLATLNLAGFQNLGFKGVWNSLATR